MPNVVKDEPQPSVPLCDRIKKTFGVLASRKSSSFILSEPAGLVLERTLLPMHSFRFARICVIASLAGDELGSALARARRLRITAVDSRLDPPVELVEVKDASSLHRFLERTAHTVAQGGGIPLLQLEIHGNAVGLRLSSGEMVAWDSIAADLEALNWACRNNLAIVLAVCEGSGLKDAAVQAIIDGHRAPFYAVIGTSAGVGGMQLALGFDAFYSELLRTSDLGAALLVLNESGAESRSHFKMCLGEQVFDTFWGASLDHLRSAKTRREHVEKLVTKGVELPRFRRQVVM